MRFLILSLVASGAMAGAAQSPEFLREFARAHPSDWEARLARRMDVDATRERSAIERVSAGQVDDATLMDLVEAELRYCLDEFEISRD